MFFCIVNKFHGKTKTTHFHLLTLSDIHSLSVARSPEHSEYSVCYFLSIFICKLINVFGALVAISCRRAVNTRVWVTINYNVCVHRDRTQQRATVWLSGGLIVSGQQRSSFSLLGRKQNMCQWNLFWSFDSKTNIRISLAFSFKMYQCTSNISCCTNIYSAFLHLGQILHRDNCTHCVR